MVRHPWPSRFKLGGLGYFLAQYQVRKRALNTVASAERPIRFVPLEMLCRVC